MILLILLKLKVKDFILTNQKDRKPHFEYMKNNITFNLKIMNVIGNIRPLNKCVYVKAVFK